MGEVRTAMDAREALSLARDLARRFAVRAAEHDREASFPFENFDTLRDAAMLSLVVPEQHGGPGHGLAVAARVVEELAKGEPSTALVLAMHYIYSGIPALNGLWDAGFCAQLWRESVAGLALINVMRVEPELGTPSRGGLPATTAERTDSGWRLSGHKMYATGSPILKYLAVWARTAGDDPEVGWFVVPNGAPGVSTVPTWDHMGMRATGSDDLILENVEIPANYAVDIRPPGDWMPPDPVQSAWNNVVLAALYNGIAISARDWLVRYLNERKPSNLGASLATLPRFQSSVGEIEGLLFTNGRLIHGLAEAADASGCSQQVAGQSSLAKYTANANAIRVVDIALSLVGNPGLSRHNELERHHRDVLCSRIHVPQDDMVLLGAGKAALGVV